MIKLLEPYVEGAGRDPLPLFGGEYYSIYPSYGDEFSDLHKRLAHLERAIPNHYRFWPGFSGGGIIGISFQVPAKKRSLLRLKLAACPVNPVYGLALGNKSGNELSECLGRAVPDRPPAWAIKYGAQRVPNPTVKATAEHANCLATERYLLVVPREKLKSIKLIEQLPTWFDSFGVSIRLNQSEPPHVLRQEMQDWFTNPDRRILCFPMEGGVANAAWQLAVIYYIAEHWDTQARGLDSAHFVANIEGKPSFRKNWTSNK